MDDLLTALRIFRKYTDTEYPFHCGYEKLYVLVSPTLVSDEDKKKLDKLGFFVSKQENEKNYFLSFRYGSA